MIKELKLNPVMIWKFRLQEMSTQERGEQGSSEDAGEGLALKAQLAAKEAEVATLVVDLQKATKATVEEEGRRLKREGELETSLASTIQERDQLASKLAMQVQDLTQENNYAGFFFTQADYEGVKKDLNILKTLEFPSVQSEDDARPLEVLILERSKALQVTLIQPPDCNPCPMRGYLLSDAYKPAG